MHFNKLAIISLALGSATLTSAVWPFSHKDDSKSASKYDSHSKYDDYASKSVDDKVRFDIGQVFDTSDY